METESYSSGVRHERGRGRDDSAHGFQTMKIGSENRSSRKKSCGEETDAGAEIPRPKEVGFLRVEKMCVCLLYK